MEEVVRFGRCNSENENVSSQGDFPPDQDQSYWVTIWVKKFYIAAREQNVLPDKKRQLRALIELFLWRNPGSPYRISFGATRKFSREFGESGKNSLMFFYSFTAVSKEHIAVLKEASVTTPANLKQTDPIKNPVLPNIVSGNEERNSVKKLQPEKPVKQTIDSCQQDVRFVANNHDMANVSVSINSAPESDMISEQERSALLEKLRLEIKSRNYSRRTNDGYISSVCRFIDRLTPESSKDWSRAFKEHLVWLLEDQKLAPSTINHHAASIQFFMVEVLDLQPGKDVCIRMKTGKALPRVHSAEKISLLINAPANPKHRLILMLTYGCGLRLGEVQHLKPEDIDIERKLLWVRKGKGKKDRMVMLDETLLPYVVAWLKEGCGTRYLFEGYFSGKAISERTIGKIYTNACQKLGINNQGGIHSLRHSFSTHLLEQGVNLRYIQELLGHASSKTTEIYTHVAAHNIRGIRSPISALL